MKTTTLCNHIARLKILISDVWTGCEISASTQAECLERLNRVWNDSGFKRLPQNARAELKAIESMYFHNAMRNKMVFCYPIDGSWIPSDQLDDGQMRRVAATADHGGSHIWLKPVYSGGKISSWENGQLIKRCELTGKPF